MKYIKTLMIVLIGLLTIAACDDNKEAEIQVGDSKISVEIDEDVSKFEAKMEDFGNRIDREIAAIDAKLEKAGEEMQDELREERAEWKEARRELNQRIKEVKKNSNDNWNAFKADVENWFDDVESEFES